MYVCMCVGASLFGMNLANGLEIAPYAFYSTGTILIIGTGLVIRAGIKYAKRRKIDLLHLDVAEPEFKLPNNMRKRNKLTLNKCTVNSDQKYTTRRETYICSILLTKKIMLKSTCNFGARGDFIGPGGEKGWVRCNLPAGSK